MVYCLLHAGTHALSGVPASRFDLNFEMLHFLYGRHRDLEFINRKELANYVFNCSRIDIHAADRHHVVAAAEQSSVEKRKCTTTSARRKTHPNKIASAIPDNRESRTPEVGDYQLTQLPGRHLPAAQRIDDLDDEFTFDRMNPAGLNLAFEAVRPNLGCAGVIEALRSPCCFDSRLGLRDIRARFSRVN